MNRCIRSGDEPLTAADDVPEFDVHELRDKDGRPYLPHEWPLARSLATGEVVKNEEVRFPRGDGDWGTMFVSSSPIRDPGGTIVAAVAVLYDITARKRAEEALLRAHEELERRVADRTADLARANESLRAEVSERRLAEQARNDLLRRLVVVQEEERVRIARELHDQMGQQLTALKLGLESLESPPPEDATRPERLRQMLALTRQIGHDMHRIAWELGPAALEELDLPTALSNYAEEWSGHSGVPVQFQCTGPWEGRLPPQVETTLYRVVQEALTNVAKHAGAGRVSLILNRHADDVLVIIEDDGVGFDADDGRRPDRVPRRRLGLAGMKQTGPGGRRSFPDRVHPRRRHDRLCTRPGAGRAARGDPMGKLRILLADDHAVVREGLRALIDAQPDLEVVGEASDGDSACRAGQGAPPGRGGHGRLHAGPDGGPGHRAVEARLSGRQGPGPDRLRGQESPAQAAQGRGVRLRPQAGDGRRTHPRPPRRRRAAASTSTRCWRARSSATS